MGGPKDNRSGRGYIKVSKPITKSKKILKNLKKKLSSLKT